MTDKLREAAQQAPMAYYALVIKADSGYESTTEGRCTADQYGAAMAALHGTAALAHQDAQNAADEVWRKLFWQAALKLKCLPSSYPDANGHVLRAIDRLMGSENAQQDAQSLVEAIRAEPTEMIHKWRVLELIKAHAPTPPDQLPEARQWTGLTDIGVYFAITAAGRPPTPMSEEFFTWCEKFADAIKANLKERNA